MSLTGGMVDVPTGDGSADAYLTRPDGGDGHRGVLFMVDAGGLRARTKEMADRIAARGYTVLMPNVFYRAGRAPVLDASDFSDPERRSRFFEALRPLLEQLTPERTVADGAAYLDHLAGIAPGPAAITGYCLGARVGWRIAAGHPDRVAALAGFHGGRLVTDDPDSPHRSASELRAEVYMGHADQDPSMTADDIKTLEQALDAAGTRYRSEIYQGARHGYTMADGPAYDEAACERHFTELFSLLERALAR